MHKLIATAAVAVAIVCAGGSVSGARSSRPTCKQPGSTVFASNSLVTMYGYTQGREDGELDACDGHGFSTPMGDPTGDFYRPPVMALSKSIAVTATNGPDDGLTIRITQVTPSGFFYRLHRPRNEHLGGLRATGDGHVAWISCPLPNLPDRPYLISPQPNCVRAGRSNDKVFLFTPARPGHHEGFKRIGQGRHIDPRSIAMSNSIVSWCQNGRRARYVYRDTAGHSPDRSTRC